MSHILEEYAKNLGVLISKPIVSEHFFPILNKKYITLFCDNKIQSKQYLYYNIVIDILRPFLKRENIDIIQIDSDGQAVKGVNSSISGLSFRQNAYVISKAIMHIGVDNIYSHYASSKKIPIVNIFGNVYPQVTNGYWSKPHEKRDIPAPWSVKPCLNLVDPKSEINLIKPELIAQSIVDLFRSGGKINFKTLNIGSNFLNNILEVVPTQFNHLNISKNDIIAIRADYGYDEDVFLSYCQNYQFVLITDQLITPVIFEKIKHNCKSISIILNSKTETVSEELLEALAFYKIHFRILTEKEECLRDIRNNHFNVEVLLKNEKKERVKTISKKSLFFSSKTIIKDGKQYLSKAHLDADEESSQSNKIIDSDVFWNESDFFYIYEQDS